MPLKQQLDLLEISDGDVRVLSYRKLDRVLVDSEPCSFIVQVAELAFFVGHQGLEQVRFVGVQRVSLDSMQCDQQVTFHRGLG